MTPISRSNLGPVTFQPTEIAKICIVVFLASYLNERREVLVIGARRFMGLVLPPLKHLGPLLVVWGAAMVLLVFIRDLGSSVMFFGAFLALIYVATGRLSFVIIGLGMFLLGAWFFAHTASHIQQRFDIWLDPFHDSSGSGYQLSQSIFAQADGGLFGRGLGNSLVQLPACHGNFPDRCAILPAPHTDFIYAVIVDELGLFGGAAVVLIYALITERGFKTAVLAEDGFSKLLATGLTTILALQAFVIIGGVTRVIPLTGVTLPFISYGGSSIVANFILLALLLMVSDKSRRRVRLQNEEVAGVNRQIVKLFGLILVLYALLFGFTSYWSVFDSSSLKANTANRRPLLEEQRIKRGDIVADDGTVIAHSRPIGKGNNKIYVRHYPLGSLFGNPIGYSFVDRGRVGFELSHNDELVGNKTEFLSVLDELQGHAQEGDKVQSALDPAAQRAAVDGLAGRQGSVVAMDPSTGEIKAMVSIPEYDPNQVENSNAFKRLNSESSSPLFNRATQGGYPPGSTMKVVTATAGLDSGDLTPNSTFSGASPIPIEGVPLANSGGEQFGDHRHDHRPDELRQHLVGPGGGEDRQGHDVQVHGPLRLQRQAPPRLPRVPALRQRRVRRQQAARAERRDRHRPRCDRPGTAPGHAAADGRGRVRRRQQGRADGAASLVEGDRPGRPGDEDDPRRTRAR